MNRTTSRSVIAVAAGAGLASAVAILFAAPAAEAARKDAQTTRVERGRYLVTAMMCNDCHTPWHVGPKGPEPDMTKMLSGHPQGLKMPPAPAAKGPWIVSMAATNTAFAGPWGVSYAANLTPDQNTGLGIWREEDFVKAIRTGKHFGVSREILPPMPWPFIRTLTDEDLKSMYAYLRTIPPVSNLVPDPDPPAAVPPSIASKK
ncbi:MAG TPA: diheme cytochrome c-553 [Thermoanaerobaculia bacterium]|nr:diheme cytochrome c-553 [Thermoanaerobaculia bacterium]